MKKTILILMLLVSGVSQAQIWEPTNVECIKYVHSPTSDSTEFVIGTHINSTIYRMGGELFDDGVFVLYIDGNIITTHFLDYDYDSDVTTVSLYYNDQTFKMTINDDRYFRLRITIDGEDRLYTGLL